ncbi:MAG: hypothetical protein A2413_08080 [Treponema sp. RIFOXYC1_FULL_61_9]|nr:MAG: hypothetical protein A2413_08080 [Treponema sp. RIFOXYC1_FULL_61_9]
MNMGSRSGRLVVAALVCLFLFPSCERGTAAAKAEPASAASLATAEAAAPSDAPSAELAGRLAGSAVQPAADLPSDADSGAGSIAGSTPAASVPIGLPRPMMRTLTAKEDLKPGTAAGSDLIIPGGTERARLPFDFAIGELGERAADSAAYRFALSFASDLSSSKDVSALFLERGKTESEAAAVLLRPIAPKSVRLGGGMPVDGGSYSFLVRFLGEESSVTGELRVSPSEENWRVAALLLDAPVKDEYADGTARFDPFAYKRFL